MCSNTWTTYVHKLSVFTVTAGSVEIEFLIVCVCVCMCVLQLLLVVSSPVIVYMYMYIPCNPLEWEMGGWEKTTGNYISK